MKVYTKTGDEGMTSLLSKRRVYKDDTRVDAYGTVDEANAAMGLAKSLLVKDWAIQILQHIQEELIALNADLATDKPQPNGAFRITDGHVAWLELTIDALEKKRIPQNYFVTPGDCAPSAALDLARTIVRRAERCVVKLKKSESVTVPVSLYLNRLSDLLFVLARCVEQEEIIALVTKKVLSVLNSEKKKNFEVEESNMLKKAQKMMAAAEAKAVEIKTPMVIAVIDAGGNLVAQQRMDGALLASISVSIDKAYTAVALKMTTAQAAALSSPGQLLYGLNVINGSRTIFLGGGIPIVEDGVVVGAIGVSGGSAEEDVWVASAGLAAW